MRLREKEAELKSLAKTATEMLTSQTRVCLQCGVSYQFPLKTFSTYKFRGFCCAKCEDLYRKQQRRELNHKNLKLSRQMYAKTPESKHCQKIWQRKYHQLPEVKIRDRERQRRQGQKPEVKEWRRNYQRERYKRPEVKERERERHKAYFQRPEVKEHLREYQRERYHRKKLEKKVND